MNNLLHINTTLDQPDLLESLVEKLAYRRRDIGYGSQLVPRHLRAVETSSTETFISGTIEIADGGNDIHLPYITKFFFTCTKANPGTYRLRWESSLS